MESAHREEFDFELRSIAEIPRGDSWTCLFLIRNEIEVF